MNDLVIFENAKEQKSLVGKFNARRAIDSLKVGVELAHFEKQVSVSQDDKLPQCVPQSFQDTILEAASLGLSFHPRLGQAYPVRYGDRCTLAIGYQGLTHMVHQAGTVKSVQAEVVHERDPEFQQWTDDGGMHIKHIKSRGLNRGSVTHSYCIAHFTNGGHHIEVVDANDLEQIQKCARTQKFWSVWPTEMKKKAAIRRGWKHWPKDNGGVIERAIEAMDRSDPVDFDNLDDAIEAPSYETISEEEGNELHNMVFSFYCEVGKEDKASVIADNWMRMMSEQFGYGGLDNFPADKFDEAVAWLNNRIERVRERHDT